MYLTNCVLPFSFDSGKTTNFDKENPVGKLMQKAIKKAAIGALMVTKRRCKSFS